jgi:hypothetical protein
MTEFVVVASGWLGEIDLLHLHMSATRCLKLALLLSLIPLALWVTSRPWFEQTSSMPSPVGAELTGACGLGRAL